ncbi:MAG: hypothetical protein H6723_12670 [Sandaracinus sp.]|nr:hypothetical protein [Sandaracinus sp.]
MASRAHGSIWLYAFLYFACYAPYTALTKALSSGMIGDPIAGPALLPLSSMASLVVVALFLGGTGWWRFATQRKVGGRSIPVPTRWTALSGLCSAVILTTTTLAYTFEGVSIVFVMLLMRGGVLVIAPIVDALSGRKTKWFSWVGLGFSFLALIVVFVERSGFDMSVAAGVDVGLYLLAYFIRLQFMSRLAKSNDTDQTKRYFSEEQLMTTPASFVVLIAAATIGQGAFMGQVRDGFTDVWSSGMVFEVLALGTLSQLVGIFGTLVFLDPRENTFSVPVNRCSSVLAGVVASTALAVFADARFPSAGELGGAGLVVVAILFLTLGPAWEKRRAAAR